VVLAVFAEEEGARFGGTLSGSRAAVGTVPREALLAARDAAGHTYQQAASVAMRELDVPLSSGFSLPIQAMLELHIEQGAVLERSGAKLGVVTAIAGIRQYLVQLTGTANHAGATPMLVRRDALAAAAEMLTGVEGLPGRQGSSVTVATVGQLTVLPNVANVIPGEVRFTVDLRDPEGAVLERCADACCELLQAVAARRGVHLSMTDRSAWEPVTCHPSLVAQFERACQTRGLSHQRMVSGALHDSCVLAQVAPVGMLFVPSRGGRSHCPEEWSDPEAVRAGTDVLHDVLAELAVGRAP
jgi:hydantoinase/carbamoylase family amidase